jgi:hypothetical protein
MVVGQFLEKERLQWHPDLGAKNILVENPTSQYLTGKAAAAFGEINPIRGMLAMVLPTLAFNHRRNCIETSYALDIKKS